MKKSKATMKKRKVKDYKYVGLVYILPWIFGFLLFQAYPFFSSLAYSFTNFDMLSKSKFVGISNYINIFTKDADFLQSLKVTTVYTIMAVPARLLFALLVAILLSQSLKGINLFRTIYYLPSIMGGSVAVAILWKFLFMKEGVVNYVLSWIHITPKDWLGSPKLALFTLGLLAVWQFGSSMVIFLAGLKQIPSELYEAGRVDGASSVRMFFSVTIPLLSPIIFFNLVMQMVNAFQEFTGAFVVTNHGDPMKSTYMYALKLYDEAFVYFKMGYASALSWILFIIIIAATALVFKSSDSWVYYEDGGK